MLNTKIKHKLSVCLLLKDNENYLPFMKETFDNLDHLFDTEYFLYENNSTDNTKFTMVEFMKTRKGLCIMENNKAPCFPSGISLKRGTHMASIRNKLKNIHGSLSSEFTLLLDTDVIFDPRCVEKLIENIKYEQTVAISPFSVYFDKNKTFDPSNFHYYDSFAFISEKGVSWDETGNTCQFKCCKQCSSQRKNLGRRDPELLENKLMYVDSAFGGLFIIKTHAFNLVEWGNSICEHHSFCKNVRKFGPIVMDGSTFICNTEIKCGEPEYTKMTEIIKQLNSF